MEKIVPRIMRGPLTPGGSRRSPILPPEGAAEAVNGEIATLPVTGLPDAVTVVSGPRAKQKLFREL